MGMVDLSFPFLFCGCCTNEASIDRLGKLPQRRVAKTKGAFTSDNALLKLVCLVVQNIVDN